MKNTSFKRVVSFVLVALMLVGIVPMQLFAKVSYTDSTTDDYYNLISKDDYDLAPGITESEIVLNNDAGTHRQVAHVVEVDIDNPYTKVIPSSKGMVPTAGNYGVEIMSKQAAYAEANGYGNVVAAMNIALSWYDSQYYMDHPELVGEPLGYLVLDGQVYKNSQGQTSGAKTCLVINYDEKDGVARPADMSKTEIRSTASAITGWEEQVIPANFGFLVKDGVNQYAKNHTSNAASRSFIGIKADGDIVMVMNDGRQSPYSAGFTEYEMAEFMLSLGCVQAINGDGGGSSAFLSQRPGEDLKINCSPSDGAERETTHGILVISTAPATGEFSRANITSDEDYYTPGSSVKFFALGTDLVGTAAEIPADAVWQLADPSFGTIDDNGLFVSNGKVGEVVVQMVYDGEVVGEDVINVVMPDTVVFNQSSMVIPYGKTVDLGLIATYDSKNVCIKPEDVTFVLSDNGIGKINGFDFTAEEEGTVVTSATLIATIGEVSGTTNISLGKGSDIIYDFENNDLTDWDIEDNYGKYGPVGPNGSVTDSNGDYWYNGQNELGEIAIVTAENGQVRNGEYALAVECDFTQIYETGYHALNLFFPETIDTTDALSVGFWIYVPYDARHAQFTIAGGGIDNGELFDLCEGWHYVKAVPQSNNKWYHINISVDDRACASTGSYYDYITEPNVNGKYTFYIDDITVDYSTAVEDRENPVFNAPTLLSTTGETSTKLAGQTVSYSELTFEATVADDTSMANVSGLDASSAKAYIDGKAVDFVYKNGKFTVDAVLADGVHTVKFEIADNMGNSSWISGQVDVQAGTDASTVKVVPQDPDADRILIGSIYNMDVVATDIETIDKVELVLDLNNGSQWELEGMTAAEGFTAEYSIQEDDNIATVIITRTDDNDATSEAVLATLPIRTWESTITEYPGYEDQTPAKLVSRGIIWKKAVEVALEKGVITYVESYTDETTGTFGMKELVVDTEIFFTNYSRKSVTGAQEWINDKKSAGLGWHEHTVVAIDDKAATCTATGYTDRTYCEVCDSVVDWGTIVPATGHTYKVVDGTLVCDCGATYTENGLVTIDGATYYVAGGKLSTGWLTIKNEWYYFDAITYTNVATLNNGYVTFEFNETGKLLSGEWYNTSKGSRYYYGPTYYVGANGAARWYEIDGKNYCFGLDGYCYKGIRFVDDSNVAVYTWYDFGTDGAMISKFDYTGAYEYNGRMYYMENGVSAVGMYEHNGAYYYGGASDYFAAIRNTTRFCDINRGLLPIGTYTFGADGKMVDKALYTVEGVLYYFELGNISTAVDSFEINDVMYPVDDTGRVAYTGVYTDASGKEYYFVDGKDSPKNGLFGDYYYIDGVQVGAYYGLVEHNGDYYYVNDYAKIIKNARKYVNKTNGLTFPNGDPIPQAYFEFDADGKMIVKQGIADDTYYINGVAVKPFYGLVKWNGDFYYVDAEGTNSKIIKNARKYVNKTNGLAYDNGALVEAAYYEFDADGKMIVKQGFHDDQYFVNGVALPAYYGLIEVDGDYYYLNDYGKRVKNMRKYVNKTNGLTFPNGDPIPQAYFEFDADGKMIIE